MLATLPLAPENIKISCYLLLHFKNDIFLVEFNGVIKMLDSYNAFAMWSFKIGVHVEFLGACFMEKSCPWKNENKVNLNNEFYFEIYQISSE